MKQSLFARGFTMIEVMVVITIIGILASVLYVNFDDARGSARDKTLMSEVKEVQLALELYRAQNGEYPDVPGCGTGVSPAVANTSPSGCGTNDYISGLVPNFITELPQVADSSNTNCVIEYRRDVSGTWYKLTAINCLGNSQIDQNNDLARCPSSCRGTSSGDRCHASDAEFQGSFAVYSAGGSCE
jgi:prepilin-type N-terminal cleavage/methylation domain-containing protein